MERMEQCINDLFADGAVNKLISDAADPIFFQDDVSMLNNNNFRVTNIGVSPRSEILLEVPPKMLTANSRF